MQVTERTIIGEIERLAEGCPWDTVSIWLKRSPEGHYEFTAYIQENPDLGFSSAFGYGENPAAAVDDVLRQGQRDPEIARNKKLEQLRQQIARLQSLVIGLPPYRPNRELCSINVPDVVNV